MRYAIIDKETNIIQNIIIWDGNTNLNLPDNIDLVLCDEEIENQWKEKHTPQTTELNEEQQLLKLLLEKYGNNF
jgi:hypothetical protein